MNTEEWRDVVGYEDSYAVSNLGKVKAKLKVDGKGNVRQEKLLSLRVNNGYKQVNLCLNGYHKTHKVHRLVAAAFLPEWKASKEVSHIDGNRANNRTENLKVLEDYKARAKPKKALVKHLNRFSEEYMDMISEDYKTLGVLELSKKHGQHVSIIHMVLEKANYKERWTKGHLKENITNILL